MNLQNQIKQYRKNLSLSQEDLADKVFVTRQTISNWENGKNYPDINSLVLLSTVFNISMDELVKGDLDKMKVVIDKTLIDKMQKLSLIYTAGLAVLILSAVPLFYFFKGVGVVAWVLIFIINMVLAFKIEKIKKENDIQTYKEIIAFMNGETLDQIQSATENGKRIYQKVILVIGVSVIAFVITYALMKFIV